MDLLDLSSEDRLLLYCSRTSMDEDTTRKVKEILDDYLDWDYIVECSIRHGISSLLFWNLNRIDEGEYVPTEVMDELINWYYGNASLNVLLYDVLGRVLKAFSNVGIDVIVLKGAFLAEVIYKNISLRPIGDVDLLIKKENLQEVRKELVLLGYNPTILYPTKWQEKFYKQRAIELGEEIQFRKHDKDVHIDLHWDIQPPSSPFQININKFWENAQPVKIAGVNALMLAPEDLLQHLCIHLGKHINMDTTIHLRWCCDIAEVIRHYGETINWEYLVQSSKNYGIELPIYQGLYLVNKYLGAVVPTNVLKTFKTVNVKSNIDPEDIFRITKIMELDIKKKAQWSEINYLKRLTKVDGIWNKAHFLFGDVFPCKEFMMQRYQIQNKKLIGVYYIIRFGTALHWGINTLWQLILYPFKLKSKKA